MAVYTDVTEDELESLPDGLRRRRRCCPTRASPRASRTPTSCSTRRAGSYILTLYEKRVDTDDLPFFLGLMQHLAGKGISCPLPVERHDGKLIGELAGRPAALITFLEGMWLRRPTADHCREVGKALAEMHLAGADFPLTRAERAVARRLAPALGRSHARADEVEPGLAAEIDAELAVFEANWPTDLPAGVIHADLFPDNVFFLGEKLSGLIDFYFACNDFSPTMSRSASTPGASRRTLLQPDQGHGAARRLQGVRPLTTAEKRGAADPGARLGAALHADAALRLADHPRRRAGRRRTRSNISASCASTARSGPPPNTGSANA